MFANGGQHYWIGSEIELPRNYWKLFGIFTELVEFYYLFCIIIQFDFVTANSEFIFLFRNYKVGNKGIQKWLQVVTNDWRYLFITYK